MKIGSLCNCLSSCFGRRESETSQSSSEGQPVLSSSSSATSSANNTPKTSTLPNIKPFQTNSASSIQVAMSIHTFIINPKNPEVLTQSDVAHFVSENEALLSQKEGLSIRLPDSVKTIDSNAFKQCKWLKAIIAPNVTHVDNNAFDTFL